MSDAFWIGLWMIAIGGGAGLFLIGVDRIDRWLLNRKLPKPQARCTHVFGQWQGATNNIDVQRCLVCGTSRFRWKPGEAPHENAGRFRP